MNSVTKLWPLFFAAVCLFWVGCSGEEFINILNDEKLSTTIKEYDSEDNLIVFYFIDDYTASDDSIIISLASSHENIHVFKVNISKCTITCGDLGLEKLPSAILRKFGRNKITIIAPDFAKLNNEVKKHKNMREDGIYLQKFNDLIALRSAYTIADISDKIIVLHIIKSGVNEENPSWELPRDEQLNAVAKVYKSQVVVFKIDTALYPELEKEFSNRAQFLRGAYPRTLYRKEKKIRHLLFGYSYEVFFEILAKYKNSEEMGSTELTIVDDKRNRVNAVQYAEDYGDLQYRIHTAERDDKLILLYIQNEEDDSDVDLSVDLLAKSYPNILVIKVNACVEVVNDYRDEGSTNIDYFPLFVIKKFRKIITKISGFNLKALSNYIQNYKDANTDPDEQPEEVGSLWTRWMEILQCFKDIFRK